MFFLKLIIRNTFRHKLRTFLTLVGVAVAILSFGLLRTVVGAWYAGVEASSANRLITRNAISLIFPLPISYNERIRSIPGVNAVSYGNWFGGIYINEKNFFPNFAVEPKSYLKLYPEYVIPLEEQRALFLNRKGCVVGRKLADRFGWHQGDQITLKGTIFPGQWEFVIVAIYRGRDRTVDETQLFFHWEYLNETIKKVTPRRADQVGFYMIGIDKPQAAPEVAVAIDESFRNSLAETLTETERAFQMSFIAMTDAIVIAIQLVSYVVIVIIMVVVANTMAMTARERLAEQAAMKALGFPTWWLVMLVVGESLLLSCCGTLLGILLTYPAADAVARGLSAFFPIFHVPPTTIIFDAAAALVVGGVAAIFPSWRVMTMGVVDGLRRIG